MQTTAIIISGAVTSGKSTLARKLSAQTKYELISEDTLGNYYKILDTIHPINHPQAIYEHCWIYKKLYLFEALYDKVILVILKLDENLLEQNYEKRLLVDRKGEYSRIDPIQQQREILAANPTAHIIEINSAEDYEKALGRLLSLASRSPQIPSSSTNNPSILTE